MVNYIIEAFLQYITFCNNVGLYIENLLNYDFYKFFNIYFFSKDFLDNTIYIFNTSYKIITDIYNLASFIVDDLFLGFLINTLYPSIFPSRETLVYIASKFYLKEINYVLFIISFSIFIIDMIAMYVCIVLGFIFDRKIYRIVYIYFKGSNEVDNNIANFNDMVILFFISISYLFYLFKLSIFLYYQFSQFEWFLLFIFLNILSIYAYFTVFNVNVFVFLKGMYSEFKLFLLSSDILVLKVFVSRLLLQFVRIAICSLIFYVFQELMNSVYICLYEFNEFFIYNIPNYYKNFLWPFFNILKILIELCDMILNFSTQFATFIIFIMWLLPFLFSYIKKKIKL